MSSWGGLSMFTPTNHYWVIKIQESDDVFVIIFAVKSVKLYVLTAGEFNCIEALSYILVNNGALLTVWASGNLTVNPVAVDGVGTNPYSKRTPLLNTPNECHNIWFISISVTQTLCIC